MHNVLHFFQGSTTPFNSLKETKTSLQTHCQVTLKTPLNSHQLCENQMRTNNSNNSKQPQHSSNHQPPLYPQCLYHIKISQCLPRHRLLLLRLVSNAAQRKNWPQLFLPPLWSPLAHHQRLRKRRKIIKMNGTTLASSQWLT